MKKFVRDLQIVRNIRLNEEHLLLELTDTIPLPLMLPGQFAEVRVDHISSAFLRRPISIHDVDYDANTISLFVKIAGKGTLALADVKAGDSINLVFPLGNGFHIPEQGKMLLVGGGCGLAPLLFLARKLHQNKMDTCILLGARNAEGILRKETYQQFGEVDFTTEDGSCGVSGMVTAHQWLTNSIQSFSQIFVCGPEVMMKAIAKVAAEKNIPCQVSLENTMACGIGACLCCVTQTDRGHLCVCTEGPVFDATKLLW
jgi:dihydroorotate dehydrogenase electron transfer subunit